jgi:CMP-N-acetylneuraminic acid synthetase
MKKIRVWAIVAARSGSKGLPGKNVRLLAGKPLIAHAINFSNVSGIFEKVLLSTDSEEYAKIGTSYGAWVPFLRGLNASQDDSMEEHILEDLDEKLKLNNIIPPDVIVWLRPTFPFRSVEDLKLGLSKLDANVDSVRLVTEGEPRLYEIQSDFLVPRFDDGGRSMIRRQEFPSTYKVFHTDIFWYRNIAKGKEFLGKKVRAVPIHKICAMDVDGFEDFQMIEALMASNSSLVDKYSH